MRLVFFDKQIKYNCPEYALPLLEKLVKQGHEIKVLCGGKSKDNISEKVSGRVLSDIYKNFDVTYFSTNSIKEIIGVLKPEIFISDFIYSGVEEMILKVFKASGSKIILIDMVGSEVLLPNRKFRFPMHIEDQFIGYLERFNNFFRDKSSFDLPFISLLNRTDITLKSDLLFVKGNFFKESLQSEALSRKKILVSGSIQFEHLSYGDEHQKRIVFSVKFRFE